jgi:CelD/BcsL family acetyltransferase involved in cellulose biosynthesis
LSTPTEVDGDRAGVHAVQVVRMGIDDARWQEIVENHPETSVFHSAIWARLLADCYGFAPFLVAVQDDGGRILAGLPIMEVRSRLTGRRWISLPFSDHVPVLSTSTEWQSALLRHLADLRRHRGMPDIELRGPTLDDPQAHQDANHVLTMTELPADSDDLWSKLHPRVRRNVRVSRREGVTTAHDASLAGMSRFYELQLDTRRRLGLPMQPRRFFRLVWERFLEPGLGVTIFAYRNDVPVAGFLCLGFGRRLTLLLAASDARYWQCKPNQPTGWAALQWGCEHGFDVFEWGRSDVGNLGLREFKSGWSAREVPLVYTTLSPKPPASRHGLARKLAAVVVRNSPAWMGRLMGEMLYRHFA